MPVSPALVTALTDALNTLFEHLAAAAAAAAAGARAGVVVVTTGRVTNLGTGVRPD